MYYGNGHTGDAGAPHQVGNQAVQLADRVVDAPLGDIDAGHFVGRCIRKALRVAFRGS
jgi:hypothetical protein